MLAFNRYIQEAAASIPMIWSISSRNIENISIEGRYKSRYSSMEKLSRDGLKSEEVNDILSLRVVLSPASKLNSSKVGGKACYICYINICYTSTSGHVTAS